MDDEGSKRGSASQQNKDDKAGRDAKAKNVESESLISPAGWVGGGIRQAPSGLLLQVRVIRALVMREIQTRIVGTRLGALWIPLEPMLHVLFFTFIFGFRNDHGIGGLPVPVFVVTGIIPFLGFSSMATKLANVVVANNALFSYRAIRPIDTLLARAFLEFVVFWASLLVCGVLVLWLGFETETTLTLRSIGACTAILLIGAGIGAIVAVVGYYVEDLRVIVSWGIRLLYFFSGVFFSLSSIPEEYRAYLMWNPVLHGIEIIREELFPAATMYHGDDAFLWACAAVVSCCGLVTFHLNRRQFLTSR